MNDQPLWPPNPLSGPVDIYVQLYISPSPDTNFSPLPGSTINFRLNNGAGNFQTNVGLSQPVDKQCRILPIIYAKGFEDGAFIAHVSAKLAF